MQQYVSQHLLLFSSKPFSLKITVRIMLKTFYLNSGTHLDEGDINAVNRFLIIQLALGDVDESVEHIYYTLGPQECYNPGKSSVFHNYNCISFANNHLIFQFNILFFLLLSPNSTISM